MAYTTRAAVEAYLQTSFDSTTTPTDTEVDQWVDDVDSEIDNLTARKWSATTETDEIYDVAYDRILVNKYPLISVSDIYVNTGTEFEPTWETFASQNILYYTKGDYIIFQYPLTGKRKVRVTYTHGVSAPTASVKHLATLLVCERIIRGDDLGNGGTEDLTIGPLSIKSSVGLGRLMSIDRAIKAQKSRVPGYHKSILK